MPLYEKFLKYKWPHNHACKQHRSNGIKWHVCELRTFVVELLVTNSNSQLISSELIFDAITTMPLYETKVKHDRKNCKIASIPPHACRRKIPFNSYALHMGNLMINLIDLQIFELLRHHLRSLHSVCITGPQKLTNHIWCAVMCWNKGHRAGFKAV